VRAKAAADLYRCGAHFVIDSVAGLAPAIDLVEGRLARGEKP
jgi:phosphonoacetaldehyde hydrolase